MTNPAARGTPANWRVAVGLAAGTVLFGALIQLESYFLYVRAGNAASDATFAIALPFLQLDSLALGALFGLAYVAARRSWLRFAVLTLVLLANLWAIINQVAYGILRQNVSLFDPEIAPGSVLSNLPMLARSALSGAGWITAFNLLLLVGAAVWLRSRAPSFDPRVPARPLSRVRWGVALAAYVALSLYAGRVVETRGIERHAVIALLTPSTIDEAWGATDPSLPDSSLRQLAYGTVEPDPAATQLARVSRSAQTIRRPNVLLVVLESVGTEQLFPGGVADSVLTPTIARIARRGVLFPNIYSISPTTTKAHVPMMTGGPAITWGDAIEYFKHAYVGPSLPGVLRALGYRTGLFSATDLGFGTLDQFYRGLPWDTLLHYGDGSGPLAESQRLSAWGVNEDHLWMHARRWIESARSAERRPFFLNFQTIATHYPYGTPPGFHGPMSATDARSRYLNSLAYTDAVLGRVLADLAARGELDRTVVIITGDHGEAFAEKHPQNMTHRNYAYDENMRSFLLFAVPGNSASIVSTRIGSHADLMPSVLGLIGAAAPVTGQNLFAEEFRPRLVYFYKDVPPGLWGLRDGNWKFIDRVAGGAPELYELTHDGDEHVNLAARRIDMVARYRSLVSEWYARENDAFLSQLGDAADLRAGRKGVLRRGLRDVRVGMVQGESREFTALPAIPLGVRLTVSMRWNWVDRETSVRVRLVSPSRHFWIYPIVIEQPWSTFSVTVPFRISESGRWTVDVWSGSSRVGRVEFEATGASAMMKGR